MKNKISKLKVKSDDKINQKQKGVRVCSKQNDTRRISLAIEFRSRRSDRAALKSSKNTISSVHSWLMFHRISISVGFLCFVIPSIVNGEQIPRRGLKNPDLIIMNSIYEERNPPFREPYNVNKQSSFVELLLVVDNDIYKERNESLEQVQQYCKELVNVVNAIYEPLNIFVALADVVVWTRKNEIRLSSNESQTLENFQEYRRRVLAKSHPNDNAHLLTKQRFDGRIVGIASFGSMCTFQKSAGVSTDHSKVIAEVASTIAHEMGHNFGLHHDSSDCECLDKTCIMSGSSSSYFIPKHWSKCSFDQMNDVIKQANNLCLHNIHTKLFGGPTCGNGFVEIGEECDCGLPSVCKNTCCDPTTCKLRSNATCATGKCCDLATCHPHEAGFECRSSAGECDLPEYCNGESEFCPIDYFKRDTEECANGKAFCYQGTCKTRDDQCKLLWGSSGKSSDGCYEMNSGGSSNGHCGYNSFEEKYRKCSEENLLCGMLQCQQSNEQLDNNIGFAAIIGKSRLMRGRSIFTCQTAHIDLGPETTDPGLVPDGSKCGDRKMCFKQKCVSIDSLQNTIKHRSKIPEKHGSFESSDGPSHLPPKSPEKNLPKSPEKDLPKFPDDNGSYWPIYAFFLGVLPFISLSLLLFFYWRKRSSRCHPEAQEKLKVLQNNDEHAIQKKLMITELKLISSTNPKVRPQLY